MDREPFLERVRIRNYKSIGACDVHLGRFTALVGRNGSGKSNFLDALRFVSDGLRESLDYAIRARGGAIEVRKRSRGLPCNFEIRLRFHVSPEEVADYGFEIGNRADGGFAVEWERLQVANSDGELVAEFHVRDEQALSGQHATMPPASRDRLYLVAAAGIPCFRSAYDALTSMGFYNLNPETMKASQVPDGDMLRRDGSNIASVVERIESQNPQLKERIREYLTEIVGQSLYFGRVPSGLDNRETLLFRQFNSSDEPLLFQSMSMSDGTLRALGILVAAMHSAVVRTPIRLVGIEEPEVALHPAAAEVLMEALREASENTQIVVTTHSPDLLDYFDVERDELLVVQREDGRTEIASAGEVSRSAISDHLYSAGELLRMDQLLPDQHEIERQRQARFGFEAFEATA